MDNSETFVARIFANIRNFERNMNKAAAQAEKVPDEINADVDANISKFKRGLLQAEALAKAFSSKKVEKEVSIDLVDFDSAFNGIENAAEKAADNIEKTFRDSAGRLRDSATGRYVKEFEKEINKTKGILNRFRAFVSNPFKVRVKADVDRRGFTRAYHGIKNNFTDPFNRRLGELATNIRTMGTVLGNVIRGSLVASMSALVPIVAAATSAVMALGNSIGVAVGNILAFVGAVAIALGGVVAYGGLAATMIARYNDEAFIATEASQKFGNALEGIKSAWNDIADTHQEAIFTQMASAIETATYALNAMIPFIDGVVSSVGNMTTELDNFIKTSPTMTRFFENMNTTGVRVFDNITRGVGRFGQGLLDTMNAAMPLIDWVAQGFNNLGTQFAEWADRMAATNGFHDFTNYVMENMPKIGRIFGDIFLGIIDLFAAFGTNSSHVFDGLERMTERFREWASELENNTAFQTFIDYIQTNGPTVVSLIGDIVMTLVNLGIAMAPLGEKVLNVVAAIFEFMSGILATNPVIGLIIGLITTLAGLFMIVAPIAIFVTTGIKALAAIFTVLSFKVIAIIAVISLLVGAFMYLWNTNEELRTRVQQVWTQIQFVISSVIAMVANVVMMVWGTVVEFWNRNSESILKTANLVWNTILTVIGFVIGLIYNIIITIYSALVNWWTENNETILNVATTVWNLISTVVGTVISVVAGIVMAIWGGLVAFWEQNNVAIMNVASMVWNAIVGFVVPVVMAIWNTVSSVIGTLAAFWQENHQVIMQATSIAFNIIATVIGSVMSAIMVVISGALTVITGVFQIAWALISNVVSIALSLILGFIEVFANLLTGNWSGAWTAMKDMTDEILGSIWETITEVFGKIGETVSNVFGWITETLGLASSDVSATTEEMSNNVSTNTEAMSTSASNNTSTMANNVATNTNTMATNGALDFNSLMNNGLTSTSALNTGVTTETGYMRDHASADISSLKTNGETDFASLHNAGATEASGLNADFLSQISGMSAGASGETSSMEALMNGDFSSIATTGSTEIAGLNTDVLSEFEGMNTGSTAELDNLLNNVDTNFGDMNSTGTQETADMNKAATQSFQSLQKAGTNAMQALSKITTASLQQMNAATRSAMQAMVSAVVSGGNQMVSVISRMMSAAAGMIRAAYGQFSSAGAYAMSGLVAGMNSMSGSVMATAAGIANRAAATIRAALKVKSPSRVMMRIGEYTSQGLALGIANDGDRVVNEMHKVSNRLQEAYAPELAPIGMEVDRTNLERSIHAIGQAEIKHDIENGLDVNQSANINLNLGNRSYRAFAEDINHENTRVTNLEESYLGGAY